MNAQEFERQYEAWVRVLNSKMKDVFAIDNSEKLKGDEAMDKIEKEEDKWLNELKRE